MITRRRFLAVSACALGVSAFRTAPIIWHGKGLGAEISLRLHTNEALAQEAIRKTQRILHKIEQNFSLYDPRSAISRLNQTKFLQMSDLFAHLVSLCDHVHRVTEGYFDPSVQAEFLAETDGHNKARWHDIERRAYRLKLHRTQSVTFNGIAQGFASDLVRGALNGLGMHEVLVNMGEFSALSGPWDIGIADPQIGVFEHLSLTDHSVATSSPNATILNGKSHIQNPRNTAHACFSTLSVVHKSAAIADGLSTGLIFAHDDLIQGLFQQANPPKLIKGLRANGEPVSWTS